MYVIGNDLKQLMAFLAGISEADWYMQLAPDKRYVLDLALEEMVSNIIKYGFDDSKHHDIQIEIEVLPDGAEVELRDDGHEFNPLCETGSNMDTCLDERVIGGVGIHLTKSMSRQMKYRRENNYNVLNILI